MHPLLSCLPYHLAADLLAHPAQSPVGREQRFAAVVFFADVNGFTAMSEALGACGKGGTEELSFLLNVYFAVIIDLVHSYGGIIGTFGGDAMTVLFPYGAAQTADPPDPATVRRALQCAFAMQERMHYYATLQTQAGTFSLTMRVGVAAGPVFCTIVGDPATRLDYVIAGSVLDRAAIACNAGGRREVVIHAALRHAAPLNFVGQRGTHGDADYWCVTANAPIAHPAPLAPLAPPSPPMAEILAAFLHPAIASRIQGGRTSFIDEHRKVTILFVGFDGYDYDGDPQIGTALEVYLGQVITVVQHYHGYLNKVDTGDKGSKYLVLFGAPQSHEDDEDRALRCALDLRALVGPPVRIGVNTGFVYCGQIGSELRREYSVIGDAVNVAARLMQAARPAQILVTQTTSTYTGDTFRYQPKEPLQLKGKSEPVAVCALLGLETVRANHTVDLAGIPLVGRERELARIRTQLALVQRGLGRIIGISGEPGIGKSRMVHEIIALAANTNLHIYAGACPPYGINSSYLVWQQILGSFFALDPDEPIWRRMQLLEQTLLNLAPTAIERLPLLLRALDLPFADTEFTRMLDMRSRKALLEALIIECVRARGRDELAHGGGLLFVFEDCHWIDPFSHDLLEALGRTTADLPIGIVAVYRAPDGDRLRARWIRNMPHAVELRLEALNANESTQLVAHHLARRRGASSEQVADPVAAVIARAQGNPFFLEEMASLLATREPPTIARNETAALPDSLRSLIMSRIDRLDEGEQIVLKVASVVGQNFKASWLHEVYPLLGPAWQVDGWLARLIEEGLITHDSGYADEYCFRHIITRDVAYESLALTTRAILHEQVATLLERLHSDELAQGQAGVGLLDMLAYHYGQSQNVEQQRRLFRLAGDAAHSSYAGPAAIAHYRRLLGLMQGNEQIEVFLRLGEMLVFVGEREQAEEAYQQALAIAHGDPRWLTHIYREYGLLLGHNSLFDAAMHAVRSAMTIAEQLGADLELAAALTALGIIENWSAHPHDALLHLERAVAIYQVYGDVRGEARARASLAEALSAIHNHAAAYAELELVLTLQTQLGNTLEQANALMMLGFICTERHHYAEATIFYQQSMAICRNLGYRQGELRIINSWALLLKREGRAGAAYLLLIDGLQMAHTFSDPRLEAAIHTNLADSELLLFADGPQAKQHALLARDYYQAVGDLQGEGLARMLHGAALHCLGEHAAAISELHASMTILETLHELGQAMQAAYTLAEVLFAQQHLDEVEQLLAQIVVWQASVQIYELAPPLRALRGMVLLLRNQPEAALVETRAAYAQLDTSSNRPYLVAWRHAYIAAQRGLTTEAAAAHTRAHTLLECALAALAATQRQRSIAEVALHRTIEQGRVGDG